MTIIIPIIITVIIDCFIFRLRKYNKFYIFLFQNCKYNDSSRGKPKWYDKGKIYSVDNLKAPSVGVHNIVFTYSYIYIFMFMCYLFKYSFVFTHSYLSTHSNVSTHNYVFKHSYVSTHNYVSTHCSVSTHSFVSQI